MDLIARHGDREEKVRVRRDDGGYEITVGDRTYHVDAASIQNGQNGAHSLRIDGVQHEVSVRRQGEDWAVTSRQGTTTVSVTDPLTHLAAQSHSKGGRRHQRIDAYMPGRVVTVLVQEGDQVAAGQGVLVLEAMKMENEIRAEHEGTIAKIFVQPGQAVDTGNPLFELE
ncbi:MAG TPA: biotin/lipoyl-containing protein [Thermoanaerobaculia bacterium]